MLRKTVSVIMLTLLLTSILTLAFNIQPVTATVTIYGRDNDNVISVDAVLAVDRIIGTRRVKYWQHVINSVIYVKNDFVLIQTDVESGEILRYQKKWGEIELANVKDKPFELGKEYFWKELVVFPERRDWDYFYTFYDLQEYPLVCWEVRYTDGTTTMYDLNGNEIGSGIPAPSKGFSLSGYNNVSWPDPWIDFRQNADYWFKKWCNSTASLSLPTPSTISSYVSDPDCQYFYELAHGDSYLFQADTSSSYYYSSTVATDMSHRPPMKFAFIGSCEGMRNTDSGTFSYEFRKGQMTNTVTIGYTGMATSPGWSAALDWQNYMLQKMNEGYTMKDSFDLASAEYPTIAPSVKFVGDTNLKVSGCVTIRVQYKDGFPRSGAEVWKWWPSPQQELGTTNESGLATICGVLGPGIYSVKAFWPSAPTPFGPEADLDIDSNGNGSTTITANYEITPPVVTVLSPQNQTYTGRSIPLTFSVLDYSPISWMGYSLDGQANTTLTDNVTLNVDVGSHNVAVYANDTYGNMGLSDIVYFSSLGGCVTVRVQYLDGYPRSGADVFTVPPPEPAHSLGTTNESGLTVIWGVLSPGDYEIRAYYPPPDIQFGPPKLLTVDENGNGNAIFTANYEITPPAIELLSPQNLTYTNNSVPLTFTVYDYSPISWIGYSLDSQPNSTITGNTVISVGDGTHGIAIYANDTFGNMGHSQIVHFTVRTGISDIAVTNIVGSKAVVGQNYSIFINVTVENQGEYTETFNVTVYANTTSIATQTIILTSGTSTTIAFTWNTTGFAKGNYTIWAYAWPVPGEMDTADNTLVDGLVYVGIPGDVDGNGKVEIKDIFSIAKAYGAYTGDPRYEPDLDINNDGKIDIKDIFITAKNFGKTDP